MPSLTRIKKMLILTSEKDALERNGFQEQQHLQGMNILAEPHQEPLYGTDMINIENGTASV
jgi:hypothetical protein